MDRIRRVWFHLLEEDSMRRIERLTDRVTSRTGIVLLAATVVLALSQTFTGRGGPASIAASAVRVPSTVASAERHGTAIRPFRVNVPESDIAELRRRVMATRWPEKETVADQSQGVPLATARDLARYWATDYDWRK